MWDIAQLLFQEIQFFIMLTLRYVYVNVFVGRDNGPNFRRVTFMEIKNLSDYTYRRSIDERLVSWYVICFIFKLSLNLDSRFIVIFDLSGNVVQHKLDCCSVLTEKVSICCPWRTLEAAQESSFDINEWTLGRFAWQLSPSPIKWQIFLIYPWLCPLADLGEG